MRIAPHTAGFNRRIALQGLRMGILAGTRTLFCNDAVVIGVSAFCIVEIVCKGFSEAQFNADYGFAFDVEFIPQPHGKRRLNERILLFAVNFLTLRADVAQFYFIAARQTDKRIKQKHVDSGKHKGGRFLFPLVGIDAEGFEIEFCKIPDFVNVAFEADVAVAVAAEILIAARYSGVGKLIAAAEKP